MKDSLKEREWDQLVYSLGRGTCVLLLGPGVDVALPDGSRKNLNAELARSLSADLDEEAPDTALLSHVAQRYFHAEGRAALEGAVERFFRSHEPSTTAEHTFARIAELPFRLILTTRIDHTLDAYLRAAGKEPVVESYDIRGQSGDSLAKGTVQEPLIYQLFGDLPKPASLILTEDDIVRFFEAVVSGSPEIPPSVRSECGKPGTVFFLVGFGIQRWHTRVLLNVLGAKGSKSRSFAVGEFAAFGRATDKEAATFFREEFRIDALASKGDDLLPALVERWNKADRPIPDEGDDPSGGDASGPVRHAVTPRVFISYVREDSDRAEAICQAMRGRGLDPFWDREGIRGGDHWESVLENEVADADYFVLLQSSELAGQTFSYVHTEVSMALKKQSRAGPGVRFIYPLLIDDVEPLSTLKEIHSIAASEPSQVTEIADDIARDFQRRLRR